MLKRVQERKERRKKLAMSLVLTFLMVFSVFGIIVGGFSSGGGTRATYNEYKFERLQEGYYTVEINEEQRAFWNYPLNLEGLPYSSGTAALLKEATIIPMTVPTNMNLINAQLVDTLKLDLVEITQLPIASASQGENSFGWPIITCDNATQYSPVIKIRIGPNTSINKEDNCIIIEGNNTGILEAHDRLIYTLTGVMSDG